MMKRYSERDQREPRKALVNLTAGEFHLKPRFASGDKVCERFPFASAIREIGTVVERYEFEKDYRYVVQFESGHEDVFFERELLSVGWKKIE